MTHQPADDLHHSPPLPQMRSELVKENKNNEYASVAASVENRHEEDNVGSAMPMQKIYQRLNTTPEQIAAFCEKWQIIELVLFGSVLRNDFRVNGDEPSDIDMLYVLAADSNYSLFDVMNIRDGLEILCQKRIDLVSKNAIQRSRNWLRRQDILSSGLVLYAAR